MELPRYSGLVNPPFLFSSLAPGRPEVKTESRSQSQSQGPPSPPAKPETSVKTQISETAAEVGKYFRL